MDKEKEIQIKKREFYLSNERTFLSYVRTSSAVIVLAVALFKFFTNDTVVGIGIAVLVLGFLIFILGTYRFVSEKNRITSGDFLS